MLIIRNWFAVPSSPSPPAPSPFLLSRCRPKTVGKGPMRSFKQTQQKMNATERRFGKQMNSSPTQAIVYTREWTQYILLTVDLRFGVQRQAYLECKLTNRKERWYRYEYPLIHPGVGWDACSLPNPYPPPQRRPFVAHCSSMDHRNREWGVATMVETTPRHQRRCIYQHIPFPPSVLGAQLVLGSRPYPQFLNWTFNRFLTCRNRHCIRLHSRSETMDEQ